MPDTVCSLQLRLRRCVSSTDDLSDELSLLCELSIERPHFLDAIERRGRNGGKSGSGGISSLCSSETHSNRWRSHGHSLISELPPHQLAARSADDCHRSFVFLTFC